MNRKRPRKMPSQKKVASKKGIASSLGVLRDPEGSAVRVPRVHSVDCENALVFYQRVHAQWERAGCPKTGRFADAQIAAWNGVRLKCGVLPKV
jgi:hypothetical protein